MKRAWILFIAERMWNQLHVTTSAYKACNHDDRINISYKLKTNARRTSEINRQEGLILAIQRSLIACRSINNKVST